MNNLVSPRQGWASNRTAVDRDALEHLLDRHTLQGRQLADGLFASARDPRLADERARIAVVRNRLERRSGLTALAGAFTLLAMVAALSLVLQVPVADQLARILAAGLVLSMFGLLARPTRGLLGLLLPLHLIMGLALLGEGGWLAAQGARDWDIALLLLGVVAGLAAWYRERAARVLDLDEAELVLEASGRPARLEAARRKAAAAI